MPNNINYKLSLSRMLSTDPASQILLIPGLIWTVLLGAIMVLSPGSVQQSAIPFATIAILVPGGCLAMLSWRYVSYRRKILTYIPVEAKIFCQQYLVQYEYKFEGTTYRGTAGIAAADKSLHSITVVIDPDHPSRSFIREVFCQPPG